jgi:hypothetical protein
MAHNIRDGLPWSAGLELWNPTIPDFKESSLPQLPAWVQPQPPPMLPDFKIWDRLIRGMPETDQSQPSWIHNQRPLPKPGPVPFPDAAPSPQPTPPAHEVDPSEDGGRVVTEIRSAPSRGLLDLLEKAMQDERRTGGRFQPRPRTAPTQMASVQSEQPVRRLMRM